MAEQRKFSFAKPFVYLALCGYLMVVVYPMLWLLYTSLKTDREIFLNPFSLPELGDLQWINFVNAWTKGHFGDYFFNSVFLTVATVAVSMLLAAMAAYALARFRFFGVRPMFFYFLAGLMIPLQLSIVPLFFQMKDFGLLNSRLGILMVYVAFGMPFAIFILTGFFKSLPLWVARVGADRWGRGISGVLVDYAAVGAAGTYYGGHLRLFWGLGTSFSWPLCSCPGRGRRRCARCRWGWPTLPLSVSIAAIGAWPLPGWC